jgi:hypothetical protein
MDISELLNIKKIEKKVVEIKEIDYDSIDINDYSISTEECKYFLLIQKYRGTIYCQHTRRIC